MMRKTYLAACLTTAIVAPAPLHAAILSFEGAATATARVAADPTCAPLPFRGVILGPDTSGTSNLGSFAYSHVVCTQGATGPVRGTFTIEFADDAFSGLLDGISVLREGVPGLFDQMFTYTITGGTGRFAGASGTFTNVGTVDVRGGPPSRLVLNFDGLISAPAVVPEPAGWVLMLGGLAIAGATMRRRMAVAGLAGLGLARHPVP